MIGQKMNLGSVPESCKESAAGFQIRSIVVDARQNRKPHPNRTLPRSQPRQVLQNRSVGDPDDLSMARLVEELQIVEVEIDIGIDSLKRAPRCGSGGVDCRMDSIGGASSKQILKKDRLFKGLPAGTCDTPRRFFVERSVSNDLVHHLFYG